MIWSSPWRARAYSRSRLFSCRWSIMRMSCVVEAHTGMYVSLYWHCSYFVMSKSISLNNEHKWGFYEVRGQILSSFCVGVFVKSHTDLSNFIYRQKHCVRLDSTTSSPLVGPVFLYIRCATLLFVRFLSYFRRCILEPCHTLCFNFPQTVLRSKGLLPTLPTSPVHAKICEWPLIVMPIFCMQCACATWATGRPFTFIFASLVLKITC